MNPNRHPRVHFSRAWTVMAFVLLSLTAQLYAQTVDTFNPGANGTVYIIAVQPDNRILVGGSFTWLGGQSRANLGRLKADGTLDPSFTPAVNGYVGSLAIQTDGKIVTGGNFTTLNSQPRNRLGRLKPDGTLDLNFNPGPNGLVYALAPQADGKLLVGGTFTTLGGHPRSYHFRAPLLKAQPMTPIG